MKEAPFSIRIFVPSGDPEGVLVASRDDWPGKAVVFPRHLLGEVKGRKEFKQPGVYLLAGPKKIYIGEGDPVGPRLEDHAKNKAFWSRAIFFTSEGGRLNKAHVQYLESRLYGLAKEAGRVALDNGNAPLPPALSEEDHAFAQNFLGEINLMLPLLGFWQLEASEGDSEQELDPASNPDMVQEQKSGGKRSAIYSSLPLGTQFALHYKGVDAKLELVQGGVLVLASSNLLEPPGAGSQFDVQCPSYSALRHQLIESGVISLYDGVATFTTDQYFSSASAAASVIRGMASNADHWVAADGANLGDLLRSAKNKIPTTQSTKS